MSLSPTYTYLPKYECVAYAYTRTSCTLFPISRIILHMSCFWTCGIFSSSRFILYFSHWLHARVRALSLTASLSRVSPKCVRLCAQRQNVAEKRTAFFLLYLLILRIRAIMPHWNFRNLSTSERTSWSSSSLPLPIFPQLFFFLLSFAYFSYRYLDFLLISSISPVLRRGTVFSSTQIYFSLTVFSEICRYFCQLF